MADGADNGGFAPATPTDLFDMEYWSLEQAKLGKSKPPAMQGRVVVVTGGAGAIGLATAKAFKSAGSEVLLVDKDQAALDAALAAVGGGVRGLAINLIDEGVLLPSQKQQQSILAGLTSLSQMPDTRWRAPLPNWTRPLYVPVSS